MKTRLIPLFLIILAMSAFLPTPARADAIINPELPCD
jgi:hypothetical protein